MQHSITSIPDRASSRRGFTIVELLIVIVVIAILAAITIVAYNGIQQRAQAATVQSDLEGAAKQLAMDQVTNSAYPATVAAANNGAGLKASPGTTYQYAVNNTVNPQTYCMTATNVTISYFVSSTNNVPTSGACPGQGAGGVAAVTNLATDPRATTYISSSSVVLGWGTGRWFGNPGGGVYSLVAGASDGPIGLTTYARKTWTVAAAGNGNTGYPNSNGGTYGVPVTSGTSYTFSSYLRTSASGINAVHMRISWYDNSGTKIGGDLTGPDIALVANVWTRITLTLTAPTGAVAVGVISDVDGGTAWQVGNTLDGTGLMMTQGSTLYNYADGNSPNWIWNGTANNSTSTGPPL